jgi:hypothetical protein
MPQNLSRCERFLSGIEFETETGNEEWIGNYIVNLQVHHPRCV